MGADVRTDLHRDGHASPFATPLLQHGSSSPWSAQAATAPTAVTAPTPTLAPTAVAPAHAPEPGLLSSLWDGAKRVGSSAQRALGAWNFDGRDAHSGKAPTQAELDKDPAWRLTGPKESLNNLGQPQRPSVGDTGSRGSLGAGGMARNLGHMALDVMPNWLGGTARGDEGSGFAQRLASVDSGKSGGEKWEGVKGGVGHQLSRVGRRLSVSGHALTGWDGARNDAATPQHDR